LTGDPVNTTSNEGMTRCTPPFDPRTRASFATCWTRTRARTSTDASGRTPLDVLDGVPAYQPAVFADADGVVPPNANAAPAVAGRGAGNPQRSKRFGPC
jgi:hypothetical protein